MRSAKGYIDKDESELSSPFTLDSQIGIFIIANRSDETATINVSINSAKFSTSISGEDYRLAAGERFVIENLVIMARETVEIKTQGGPIDYYYTVINEIKPIK